MLLFYVSISSNVLKMKKYISKILKKKYFYPSFMSWEDPGQFFIYMLDPNPVWNTRGILMDQELFLQL